MAGFNWVDIIILLIFASALYYGARIGFLTLLLVFGGFFGTLFLMGWLLPHLLPIHNQTLKAIVNGNLVLILAIYAAIRGNDLGKKLHLSLRRSKYHAIESGAGVVLSVGSALIAVWLIAAGIGMLPFAGLSNSANDAFIVQNLDRHLPSVPAVFEEFNKVIHPNAVPKIYLKEAPYSSIGVAAPPSSSPAATQAGQSVVRITSFGCGGLIDGSGFAVGPNLIATAAHVIAGVHRPIIKVGTQSFAGVPVLFDANQDFAVLRVSGLNIKPLLLVTSQINGSSSVSIIGYPKSIFTFTPGTVRNDLQVFGTNIYGVNTIGRNIYEIQTQIDFGNSGGPVIQSDGRVAGVVISKSDNGNYGYALTSSSLAKEVNQAQKSYRRVSTGACYTS